ncbi:MAG: Ldh family oxidoreductase [Roseibium sp.]|nr:Ldh family oxidoreductase [Roseibium sp.]
MKFTSDQLLEFSRSMLAAAKVRPETSKLVAETLVCAELWGHQSHGLLRLPWYLERIATGATDRTAEKEIVIDGGAIAVLDGHNGIGQDIAHTAMSEAIRRSKAHGVGVVSVRRSGHFGTAMYFTRMAAEAGCIGIITTNASPAMAPWGGREKKIGNNPWSIGAPTRKGPMVMDIANTVVARGKIFNAIKKGENIPDDWAIDSSGAPTVNPEEALKGLIQPLAAHKGYVISVMMDVLSGVLSGSAFMANVVGPYMPKGQSGVGHLVIALNVNAFRPYEDFLDDMDVMVDQIKSTPLAVGFDEIFYPGELETRNAERHQIDGVSLPTETVEQLNKYADGLGARRLT